MEYRNTVKLVEHREKFDRVVSNLSDGKEEVDGAVSKLSDGKKEVDKEVRNSRNGKEKVDGLVSNSSDGKEEVDGVVSKLSDGKEKVDGLVSNLSDGKKKVDGVVSKLSDGKEEVDGLVRSSKNAKEKGNISNSGETTEKIVVNGKSEKKAPVLRKAQLFYGFLIGLAFGFLLDRGGATDFNIITNQLLLTDFTILKIIFSAIITGMTGIHILTNYVSVELNPKPFQPKPIIIGGLIFGAGFAILGLCPGTAAGAVGTGSIHALFGVMGMLFGAGLFAAVFPKLEDFVNRDNKGRITIPQLLGVNKWWVIIFISVILAGIMYFLEINGL